MLNAAFKSVCRIAVCVFLSYLMLHSWFMLTSAVLVLYPLHKLLWILSIMLFVSRWVWKWILMYFSKKFSRVHKLLIGLYESMLSVSLSGLLNCVILEILSIVPLIELIKWVNCRLKTFIRGLYIFIDARSYPVEFLVLIFLTWSLVCCIIISSNLKILFGFW